MSELKKFIFKNSVKNQKPLLLTTLNEYGFTAWLSCVFRWARMLLVISIKQINAILFLFSFKKIASKIDKRVMLSYLLQYITNALNSIFLTPSKIPTWTSQTNSMKICSICILPQKKNLTSNHCLKLKSLGFSVLKYIVLTFCWHSIEALAAFAS